MSQDFKSNQIRVARLIASGGISGGGIKSDNNVGLTIYSSSHASNLNGGITDAKMFDKVGQDVMLVVSGNIGGTDAKTGFGPNEDQPGCITLFTGDVYVSGNLGIGGTGGGGEWSRDAAGFIYPQVTTDDVYIGGNNLSAADTVFYDNGGMIWNKQAEDINIEMFADDSAYRVLNIYAGANTSRGGVHIGGRGITKEKVHSVLVVSGAAANSGVLEVTHECSNAAPGDVATNTKIVRVVSGASDVFNVTARDGGSSVNLNEGISAGPGNPPIPAGKFTFAASIPYFGAVGAKYLISASAYGGDNRGSDNRVMILSGGGPTSRSEALYPDTCFFVSGAIGMRKYLRGTSVFGGDLVVSGNTSFGAPQDYYSDATVQIHGDGSNPQLFISASRGPVVNGPVSVQVKGKKPTLQLRQSTDVFSEFPNITFISDASGGHQGGQIYHSRHPNDMSSGNFAFWNRGKGATAIVQSNADGSSTNAIIVSGSDIKRNVSILILSGAGSGPSSNDEAKFKNVNFFVSGAIGSAKSSTVRGTSVFGGDLVISGAVIVNDSQNEGGQFIVRSKGRGTTLTVDAKTDKVGIGGPATPSSALHIQSASNVDVHKGFENPENYHLLLATNDNTNLRGVGMGFKHSTNPYAMGAGIIFTDRGTQARGDLSFYNKSIGPTSLGTPFFTEGLTLDRKQRVFIYSGSSLAPTSPNEADSTDMNFFVSGAIKSRGTNVQGTSVFGGDVLVSGTLYYKSTKTYHFEGTVPASANSYFLGTQGNNGSTVVSTSYPGPSPQFNQYLMPFDGKIIDVKLRAKGAGNGVDTVNLEVKHNTDGNPDLSGGAAAAVVTLNDPLASTSNTMYSSTAITNTQFTAGSILGVLIGRNNAQLDFVNLVVICEFNEHKI